MNHQEKSKQRDAILKKIIINTMTDSPGTEKYVDEFVNMISIEIGEAISPINEVSLPFIICCLERYVEFLRKDHPKAANVADSLKTSLTSKIASVEIPVWRE